LFFVFISIQFKPLLEGILQTDKKLTEKAKELEKAEMERKRQADLAKLKQVIIEIIHIFT
jgi:hypothetical protein